MVCSPHLYVLSGIAAQNSFRTYGPNLENVPDYQTLQSSSLYEGNTLAEPLQLTNYGKNRNKNQDYNFSTSEVIIPIPEMQMIEPTNENRIEQPSATSQNPPVGTGSYDVPTLHYDFLQNSSLTLTLEDANRKDEKTTRRARENLAKLIRQELARPNASEIQPEGGGSHYNSKLLYN